MRTQMPLMLPRSCLEILDQDKTAQNLVVKNPTWFLEVMPRDDMVKLISQCVEADPKNPAYYCLVKELMKPGHLRLIERLHHVISRYGTY